MQNTVKSSHLSNEVSMKTKMITICIMVASTILSCSSTNSSISSEDMRLMKQQSEHLLSIDSSRCTPDLIKARGMEGCYWMVRLNNEYKKYKILFDTIVSESSTSSIAFNNGYVNDRNVYNDDASGTITKYKVIYRIYDGIERLRTVKIVFYFYKNAHTYTLYCYDVRRIPLVPIENLDF
jgi:hypothetical protein